MRRTISVAFGSACLMLMALVSAPQSANAAMSGAVLDCDPSVCNKYDPDVDCWDGTIYWYDACREESPFCDGIVTPN